MSLELCPYEEQQEAGAAFPRPGRLQGREAGVRVISAAPASLYSNQVLPHSDLISVSFPFDTQTIPSCPPVSPPPPALLQ